MPCSFLPLSPPKGDDDAPGGTGAEVADPGGWGAQVQAHGGTGAAIGVDALGCSAGGSDGTVGAPQVDAIGLGSQAPVSPWVDWAPGALAPLSPVTPGDDVDVAPWTPVDAPGGIHGDAPGQQADAAGSMGVSSPGWAPDGTQVDAPGISHTDAAGAPGGMQPSAPGSVGSCGAWTEADAPVVAPSCVGPSMLDVGGVGALVSCRACSGEIY